MVVINGKVFAVVPVDDLVAAYMRELDPTHVELAHFDIMYEAHRRTAAVWRTSLEQAEWMCRGIAQWVCPD